MDIGKPPSPAFSFRCRRGKYLDALVALRQHGALRVPQTLTDITAWIHLLTQLRQTPWVVYLKPPLSGAEQVLDYLARYTHRVALSNDRLVSVNAEEVCLRYRDRAHGNASRLMRLPSHEFLRRFLLHVLPAGFKRIRHYGLTANRSKATQLTACRAALHTPTPTPPPPQVQSAEAFLIRLTGRDVRRCPTARKAAWSSSIICRGSCAYRSCALPGRPSQHDEPPVIQSPLALVAKRAGQG
jgi:hypothetical protein